MKVISTLFKEVFLLETKIHNDFRGSFIEIYKNLDFTKAIGTEIHFIQDNLTYSKMGTLRGLHYSTPPLCTVKISFRN